MSSTTSCKIISLNARGLAARAKRHKLYAWFKKQKADIIFIQETHCTKSKLRTFKHSWDGMSFYGLTESAYSRGVGMLFRDGFDGNIIDYHATFDGRQLLVNVEIENKLYTLVNIYSPNEEKKRISFLESLPQWIKRYSNDNNNIIMGGDFNCCLTNADRSSKTHLADKSRDSMKNMIFIMEN